MRTLVWFRNDLRVSDHMPLTEALAEGEAVGIFLLCPRQWRSHDVGDNRIAFLLRCLTALQQDLRALNVPLLVVRANRFADAPKVLLRAADDLGARRLAFAEEYPLNERVRDSKVTRAFEAANHRVLQYPGSTLVAPGELLTEAGEPYSVFTPFKRKWLATIRSDAWTPLPVPEPQPPLGIDGDPVPEDLDGAEACRLAEYWPGGSDAGQRRLARFFEGPARDYDNARDRPAQDGTSGLSPYLAIGALSPRECLARARTSNGDRLQNGNPGIDTWISELIWRDFYRHVITLFPHVNKHQAFRPEADQVPWRHSKEDFQAWCDGRTGYPLVDAAMRQLRDIGWMHNRLRMIAAMFLTKHLLIDWRQGERYFMEQLVDGDFAANNGGWQWSASTGTDAAPYFRIFNPYTQAQRFDPDGTFVLRYLPELQPLADRYLAGRQSKRFFEPGDDRPAEYPPPIVEHRQARQRALDTFKSARQD